MTTLTVGFAGMTHLGFVSAAAVASKGFKTICYDGDRALVGRLAAGESPVIEPGLPELLRTNGDRQQFTSDLGALAKCDVVYIAPDVPTDDKGESDLAPIRNVIADVMGVLAPQAIMVVLCQVPPGFTRGLVGLPHERLYYQVETLIFGRAVERATQPERYIIGCVDPHRSLDPRLAEVLNAFGCPILPMRYESAELAKISINMCLVASVSVANTLAELCEQIGAVWSEIVPALKLDRRIGPYSYLSPGLGIAGGNLERDLATVLSLSAKHKTDGGVVSAWLKNSHHRRNWAADTLRKVLLAENPNAQVAVWGLAYKENTHSVKNSPSLATLSQLPNVSFTVHDPVVAVDAVKHAHVKGAESALAALDGAEAVMILTPWPQYRSIPAQSIAAKIRGKLVLDPYGVLNADEAVQAGLTYYTLGRPPTQPKP